MVASVVARCAYTCIAGLAWFAAVPAAHGQIVNVQPLLAAPEEAPASGAVEGALDVRTGNTRLMLLSASALGRVRSGRHSWFVLLRYEMGVQGGERFLDKDFEHLRYRFELLEALQLEAFVQHDRDEFRRLAARLVWGTGVRVPFHPAEPLELALGAAYLWELERLSSGPEPDSGAVSVSHRLSSYATLQLRLDEHLQLGQSTYAQPRWDRPDDIRVLNETELLVSLREELRLKLSFALGYDSLPPAGRRKLDTASKTSLQLRF